MIAKLKALWSRLSKSKRHMSQRSAERRRLEAMFRKLGQSRSEAKLLTYQFFNPK